MLISQFRKLHTRRPDPVLLQPLVQFLANGLPEALEYTAMATALQAQRVFACEKSRMEFNESQTGDAKCITSLGRTGLHCQTS
jgi:hypothetical protein